MKKITRATFKSFVKKNLNDLYIKSLSHFNGMTDCVEDLKDSFRRVNVEKFDLEKYGWGLHIALTGRDWFENYEDDNFVGYNVYNSCGEYLMVVKK